MEKLFEMLCEVLQGGRAAVLVTVVASSGSTPRGAGARMLVTQSGREAGTIGGGAVEHQAEEMAKAVLQSGQSRMERYVLRQNEVRDLGMVCGGEVQVCFRHIPAGDAGAMALAQTVVRFCREGGDAWLVEEITPERESDWGLYRGEEGFSGVSLPAEAADRLRGQTARLEYGGRTYFCERLGQPGVVYIFGGGHVSQALVPALAAVDFRCVVLEDRPEFTKAELFPGAAGIRLIDNSRIAEYVTITPDDYVAVMTRGHKDDLAVQAQVLRTPARYIGVIGSRRKTATVFAALRAQGFSDVDLSRITTPIGLAISAETPAEIAVSIAAQLIEVRAKHRGG